MSQYTIEVIRGGTSYDLTDMTTYSPNAWQGFGMAPLHRVTTRGPMQHGETDVGFRLDARTIVLSLNVDSDDLETAYDNRETLFAAFAPTTDPLILQVTYPGSRTRAIECYLLDGLSGDSAEMQAYFQIVTVRLYCPDPVWYDPTLASRTFELGGGGGTGGVVPYEVPYYLGASTLDASETIPYGGNWLTYPEVVITGPIRDCIITNNSTDEKLDLTGTTIGSSDQYTIVLEYGYKTVTDSSGTNQIADLTSDSDLATFHLAASSEVASGNNSITVQGNDATEQTGVMLRWYERFLGI